jgi:hypothetical protein
MFYAKRWRESSNRMRRNAAEIQLELRSRLSQLARETFCIQLSSSARSTVEFQGREYQGRDDKENSR